MLRLLVLVAVVEVLTQVEVRLARVVLAVVVLARLARIRNRTQLRVRLILAAVAAELVVRYLAQAAQASWSFATNQVMGCWLPLVLV